MIRVLHMIGSLDIGGSQVMIMNLYKKIDRSKIQFDFIVDHEDQLYFADEIKDLGGKIYFMPGFTGKNIIKIKKAWNKFFKEHKEYKILHSHVRSYASVYLPIAKKHGLKTIIHSHSTSNGKGIGAVIKEIMQLPLRRQADYLFACSDEAGRWLFGKKALSKNNYMVISNAIDSDRFKFNQKKRDEMRELLHIENKYVIGTIGRLSIPKNHQFLIDVFYEIHKLDENTILMIVGDGELRNTLEKQVENLGLKDSVIFVGNKSDTENYYQAMDVFAFPSLWEGLGISAIEAQCSGLHCVVSERIPNSVDIEAGLIDTVDLNNAKLWGEKLISFKNADREEQLESLKKSGYDVTENAIELEKFYLNI